MIFVLAGLALVVTYFTIKTRNLPLGAIGAAFWFALWKYISDNYSATLSNSTLQLITIAIIVAGIVTFFWSIVSNGNDDKVKFNRFGFPMREPPPVDEGSRRYGTGRLGNLSESEYKELIHKALHREERR